MAVQATFQSMGLRPEKAVSAHLLLENAHESNLVSDISKVDYLAGNLGRTHLRPLPSLPRFVDDVYVFGYLRCEDCVVHGGRLSCTTREDSSAKNTFARISTASRESMGTAADGTTCGHIQTNIFHTLATWDNAEGGAIHVTVSRIEFDTDKKAQAKWQELYPETEPAGLFVTKVDVSEIPMDELQASLPAFECLLLAHGYGLYCIDYTQDFLGVLDRYALMYHCASKGFREQGDLASAMRADVPTILANTGSVGDHVCTWVRTSKAGYTVRTKLYNKVVSNFEAGEVRKPIGQQCRLSERASAPHLLASRCTGPGLHSHQSLSVRLPRGDLSADTAKEVVAETMALVSPSDLPEEQGLFVAQPPAKQWEKLAVCLDRCLLLADRPQGSIFVSWYAHTTTGRG